MLDSVQLPVYNEGNCATLVVYLVFDLQGMADTVGFGHRHCLATRRIHPRFTATEIQHRLARVLPPSLMPHIEVEVLSPVGPPIIEAAFYGGAPIAPPRPHAARWLNGVDRLDGGSTTAASDTIDAATGGMPLNEPWDQR